MEQNTNSINQSFAAPQSKYNRSIPLYLILTIITLGIFNLYWNYLQMEACNTLLKRTEFRFGRWILFSILTFGIYHIFYQYKMGSAIVEIQRSNNKQVFESLPIVSLFTTLFGFSIVADCIHQHEINKLVG